MPEDIIESHNHAANEMHILKKEFERNLIVRSSTESLPMPKIYQQEETKILKELKEVL